MHRFTAFLLSALLLASLAGCGSSSPASSGGSGSSAGSGASSSQEEAKTPEPYDLFDPTQMPEGGVRDGVTYTAWDGIVEHLFFHPVVAYPELAFDGDSEANGIDDYMVKPIDVNELLLRVEALLRRAKIIYEKKLEFDHVCLDYINLTVTIDEKSQILPQKEFQLLYKLLSFPNHTFTRQQIMDELWGYDSETDIRTVDVHINRLRDRFRDIPYFQIQTVRGLGYKGIIEK